MYCYNNTGEDITRYFIDENCLVVDYENFEAGITSSNYMQAAISCTIYTVVSRGGDIAEKKSL